MKEIGCNKRHVEKKSETSRWECRVGAADKEIFGFGRFLVHTVMTVDFPGVVGGIGT